jgi:hypothetical protein
VLTPTQLPYAKSVSALIWSVGISPAGLSHYLMANEGGNLWVAFDNF